MVSKNIRAMIDREKIEMELIKLEGGERLLRLTERRSGLSLERKLNPDQPVTDQKNISSRFSRPRSREQN